MDSNILSVPEWPHTGTFVLKDKNKFNNKDLFDNNGNLLYSFHVRKKYPKHSIRLETDLGFLLFSDTRPDVVEIFNSHNSKIGQLLLKEIKMFLLEFDGNQYSIGDLESETLSIKDRNYNIHLSIEKMEEGSIYNPPYYNFSLEGKIPFEPSLLITLFVAYFQTAFKFKMYPTEYTFKANVRGSFKFYDRNDYLYAKTRSSIYFEILLITCILLDFGLVIGFALTNHIVLAIIVFFINMFGLIIIAYIMTLFYQEPIILEESGETIAKFKFNFRQTKASFTVPSRNWTGTIKFENGKSIGLALPFKNEMSEKSDVFITSDRNYVLKNHDRVEGCLSIYRIDMENLIIQNDPTFDNYKSLVFSAIIFRKYYDYDDD